MSEQSPAPDTRRRASYDRSHAEYSKLYGVEESGRTIRRWVRRGKELNDLPPLDQPSLMAGWARRVGVKVLDVFLSFENPTTDEPQTPEAANAAQQSAPLLGDEERDFSHIKGLGMEENVQGLRVTLAIAKSDLDSALRGHDPNLVTLRQNNYNKIFNQYRLAEISLIEFHQKMGDLIDKEKVRTELAQVFESLRLMRETMPRRIVIALEPLLPRRFQRILAKLLTFLIAAIEKARADEENIFRNLETLDGPDAVRAALADPKLLAA